MDHHEQTIAEFQLEQKAKVRYQYICYRIDDMLEAIREVTLDAGGLLEQKQDILTMPVSKLLEIFANNNIHIELKYRKPFEFKLNELREKEKEK